MCTLWLLSVQGWYARYSLRWLVELEELVCKLLHCNRWQQLLSGSISGPNAAVQAKHCSHIVFSMACVGIGMHAAMAVSMSHLNRYPLGVSSPSTCMYSAIAIQ